MANNDAQFSEMMTGLTQEQLDRAVTLHEQMGEDPEYGYMGFEVDHEDDGNLWLYCMNGGYNEDALIAFVQAVLRDANDQRAFVISIAYTCSKPRIGEFDGGWLVITQDECESGCAREEGLTVAARMDRNRGV